MEKINLSFLWEAFALASGVPPSLWQVPPDYEAEKGLPDRERLAYRESVRTRVSPCKLKSTRDAGDAGLPVRRLQRVLLLALEALH
jgi:hypothetical protein